MYCAYSHDRFLHFPQPEWLTSKFGQLVGRLVTVLFQQDSHLSTVYADSQPSQLNVIYETIWCEHGFPLQFTQQRRVSVRSGKKLYLSVDVPSRVCLEYARTFAHNATSAPICRTPGLWLLEKKQKNTTVTMLSPWRESAEAFFAT